MCAWNDLLGWKNVQQFVRLKRFTWAAKRTTICVPETIYLGGKTYKNLCAWNDLLGWQNVQKFVCPNDLFGRQNVEQCVPETIYLGGKTYSKVCAWNDLLWWQNVQQFVCLNDLLKRQNVQQSVRLKRFTWAAKHIAVGVPNFTANHRMKFFLYRRHTFRSDSLHLRHE
jgi:hypothetical protein